MELSAVNFVTTSDDYCLINLMSRYVRLRPTVVGQFDECHCIAVALLTGIGTIPVDSTLARVLIVVDTGPKVTLSSIAIVPPRFLYAAKLQRGTETVVLQ